jgi:hypothetical protein
MSGHGLAIIGDGALRLAAGADEPRLHAVAERLRRAVTVAVSGRGGVGVSTVAAVLSHSVLSHVVGPLGGAEAADVQVLVLAEVAKPEDVAVIVADECPRVVVVNKADLSGFTGGGPMATARRRCAELAAHTGAAVVPMAALLARAAAEPTRFADDMVDDLRILVDEPADLSSPDAFVTARHRLPRGRRQRLAETLDLFGIAHCVVALRDQPQCGAGQLRLLLRELSGVDAVCSRLGAAVAEVRYRRLTAAITELRAVAVTAEGVAEFLDSDEAVLARMAVAVDVVQTAGVAVDAGDDPAAHRRRASRWRHYGAGPVSALHRACAADITRGSLRLLAGGRA